MIPMSLTKEGSSIQIEQIKSLLKKSKLYIFVFN